MRIADYTVAGMVAVLFTACSGSQPAPQAAPADSAAVSETDSIEQKLRQAEELVKEDSIARFDSLHAQETAY